MSEPRLVVEVVEVIDEERIVERGTAQVTWFVRANDAWVHVSSFPHARAERLDAGAGTVWQTRIELDLARGTRLMCVESRPRDYDRGSPLDYLTRGSTRQGRKLRRRYYCVGRAGALVVAPESPSG